MGLNFAINFHNFPKIFENIAKFSWHYFTNKFSLCISNSFSLRWPWYIGPILLKIVIFSDSVNLLENILLGPAEEPFLCNPPLVDLDPPKNCLQAFLLRYFSPLFSNVSLFFRNIMTIWRRSEMWTSEQLWQRAEVKSHWDNEQIEAVHNWASIRQRRNLISVIIFIN